MMRALEELCANSWPALQTLVVDGWLVRLAQGYSRRANSVAPLVYTGADVEASIDAVETVYRDAGQPAVFKLTTGSRPADLDARLQARGYRAEATTSIQTLALDGFEAAIGAGITVTEALNDEWLAHFCRLNAIDPRRLPTMRRMLDRHVPRQGFLSLQREDEVVGVGLGVLERGHIGLYDIGADARYRGQGLGRRVVTSLLAWGMERGAHHAYLAVMLDNAPALRLYAALGFSEVYQYWYRVKDQ